MIVAIHQPNYFPWLGYFHKIARADVFVFLDNVQFSKGSYTNRVRILSPTGVRWLSMPVAVRLGMAINEVGFADERWMVRHGDMLKGAYNLAPAFGEVWPELAAILARAAGSTVAAVNIDLIKEISRRLGLACEFRCASELPLAGAADDRLIEIVTLLAPSGRYLSGSGGAKYQDPEKFSKAGLSFAYADYRHPTYRQTLLPDQSEFIPGLSVIDALFHLGWEETARLVVQRAPQ